ncbi:MAG: hypothetical protein J6Z31_00965, partial [Fibrobacter sp.]|nr:hypothetical protein [Fibrobacter sp.]
MLPQKPLPRKFRLFNRAVLILLGLVCIIQCSRCAFGEKDEADTFQTDIPEDASDAKDSLPQRDLPDSVEPSHIEQKISQAVNLDHVYAQKDTGLAHAMDTYLRRFHPDNALYVAVDAKTNEILAWGERK